MCGINLLSLFFVSGSLEDPATFAGLAGGLHALNYEIVAAEAVGSGRSGTVLLMAYIGGVHNFFGAVLCLAMILNK